MMGRWRDGSSLIKYPDGPGNDTGNAFAYADDPAGARCRSEPTCDVPTRATPWFRRQDNERAG